jgi:hypothetical protein
VDKFEVPNLFCLKFITDEGFTLSESFKANPQELHWETPERFKLPHIAIDFAGSIECTLARHKCIKVMKVPSAGKDLILDVFKDLVENGKVSMDILGVRVLDDNSVVFNLDIH